MILRASHLYNKQKIPAFLEAPIKIYSEESERPCPIYVTSIDLYLHKFSIIFITLPIVW